MIRIRVRVKVRVIRVIRVRLIRVTVKITAGGGGCELVWFGTTTFALGEPAVRINWTATYWCPLNWALILRNGICRRIILRNGTEHC